MTYWSGFIVPYTGCPAKLFPLFHSSFSWLPSGPAIKFWTFFNSLFSGEFKNVPGFIILPIYQQDIAQLLCGTQIKNQHFSKKITGNGDILGGIGLLKV